MEEIAAKTIVTRTKNTQWFGTEYNMNIYRGCPHGCIYCDSRSDCYGTQDFDRVRVKANALAIIRDDLRRKVKPGVVGTGSMSDPYNPHERDMELTRHAMELLSAYSFGVAIATKSPLVTRDVDVLQEIKEHSPVLVKFTVTAAEDSLSKKVEPYTAPSSERLEAMKRLSEFGIFCGVIMMPVLPFIEDTPENVLGVVRLAAQNGARFVYPAFGMTMRDSQRDYYFARLEEQFPGIKQKYIRQYGTNYQCTSPRAKELWDLFTQECDKLGLLYSMQDIISGYRMGYGSSQLRFF